MNTSYKKINKIISCLLLLIVICKTSKAQVAPFGTIGFIQGSSGNKGFVMETKFGRFTQMRSSLDKTNEYYQNSLEIRLAVNKAPFAFGNRAYGIRGFSFYPQFSIGGVSRNGVNKNFAGKSLGIIASPGINIGLPYFVIEANLQSAYYFKPDLNGKKFAFTPTFGIKIDGLFEVLDVSAVNSGKYGRWETTKTGESRERRQGYDVITKTYKTEFKIRDYVYHSVQSFSGITPRYNWSKPDYAGHTKMAGLGYNMRISIMSIDAIVETGQQGYASNPKKRSFLFNPFPKDNAGVNKDSSQFNAEGKQTRVFVRMGVDLKNIITRMSLGAPQGKTENPTAAFRVMGGIGLGYAIVKKPTFINANASEKMEGLLETNPDLWRSSMNDPTLTKSGLMYHAFIAFEFGVVCVELNTNVIKNAPMSAGGLNTCVSYIIPIRKIVEKYKETKSE
jgi:hypothetical protein